MIPDNISPIYLYYKINGFNEGHIEVPCYQIELKIDKIDECKINYKIYELDFNLKTIFKKSQCIRTSLKNENVSQMIIERPFNTLVDYKIMGTSIKKDNEIEDPFIKIFFPRT